MAHYSPEGAFDQLKKRISNTVSNYFPMEGKTNRLVAKRVWVEDSKDIDDIRDQKETKVKKRSWTVPVRVDLELQNMKTGKVLDRQTVNVAQLPKITRRYTYIVNGNEWQVNNLFRKKSGVYTRIRRNGELTADWNLAKGRNFDMDFKPKTKKMTLKIGDANIPLYSILKTMGVDDDSIERVWGRNILSVNRVKNPDSDIRKYYRAMKGTSPGSIEEARELVREEFEKTVLYPDTTKITLGQPFKTVDGKTLLAGSSKILRVARQEEPPDDRDSLQFKELHSAEDLLDERLNKWKVEKDIKRKISNTLDKHKKVRAVVSPDTFGKPVRQFFGTTLTELPDQTNPVSFISGNRKTTLVAPGEGGIGNIHQITLEAQSINPSHVGFLDPLQTPESEKIGVNLQLASQVSKEGHDLKIPVYDTKTKKKTKITPHQALMSNLAFPDQYTWDKGKPTPIGEMVKASDSGGTVTMVPSKSVDYVLGSSKGMFDLAANMIPFLQSDQGNRTMVASRQLEQAVALTGREVPLVQTQTDSPRTTFEQGIGAFVGHTSPVDGTVMQVKKDGILIKDKAGKQHEVQTYHDFPLNDDKSVINSAPLVKAGDSVTKGQTVADTNFTRDGTLALGTNLKVAYMPYKGYNFEDGIVVSETAARKLTSDHMFRENVSAEKTLKMDKKKFLSYSAGKVTRDQADKLDDQAVIKEGETVQKDDVILGVLKEEVVSPDEQKLGLFSKGFIRPWKPREVRWTKDTPGKVTKVVKHGKNTTVYIKAEAPAVIGDKIVGRHGNKGIITCHDDQTEVLTEEGWKRFQDLTRSERVCALNPDTGKVEYHWPERYIDEPYSGRMYRYQGRRLDLLCTPEHKHYVRTRRGKFQLEKAQQCFGLPRIHLRTGDWEASDLGEITIPGRPDGYKLHKEFCEPRSYDPDLFLEFFGYWVTEGCLAGSTHVHVAQSKERNPETYDRIVEVLYGMGYEPSLQPNVVVISDPRLHYWLRQFGKARDKFIPRQFLSASARQLRILADAAFAGDGGVYYREKDNHTRHELFTSSKRLADDYQELAFKVGVSANVKPQEREGGTEYVVRWSFKDEVWVNNDKRFDNESWEHYEGRVYCVEVQNHIVYVRRNGIPVWSGNSVLPDHEMPQDKDGNAVEVLLNPTGVPTRINLGQMLETAAAKIAQKTGKPYVVNNFDPKVKDYTRDLQEKLKKHGISDTEDLFDPVTKRRYKSVLTGPQYILKLHHTAEKGLSVRSRDAYDSNMLPVSGGPKGGQSMDAMGMYAMLAHDARENIREMSTYKSDANDDFWAQLQAGDPIPAPKTPFVFKKFEGYLKGMGLDVRKEGTNLILQPLTDKKTLEMSNGALPDAGRALRAKDAKEEPGGIFDLKITGGVRGKKWSHIKLPSRMPNPVFEAPIISLLGLNQKSYKRVVEGEEELGGKTGPGAIVDALKGVDAAKTKKELEAQLPSLRATKLDHANKKLKYLRALDRAGMSPKDAYTMKHLPVLPPMFRPIAILDSGDINYADVNRLYNHIGHTKLKLDEFDPALPPEEKLELDTSMYDAIKAATLLGGVHQGKHRNAIMQSIAGGPGQQPKEGFFQDKIIGRRQDLSMRGVIIPEPSLGLDEVGIPRKAATELYKPFVVRKLVGELGHRPLMAQEMVKQDHPAARSALESVLDERPLFLKRDPVLHKFGVQAFKPKLVRGKALKIHPLATAGYNADFDGDKMSAFVPVSNKAVKEAYKMLPSNNLFSPSTGFLMSKPSQESMLGLYKITEIGKKSSKRFKNAAEAAKAVKDGSLDMNELIRLDSLEGDPFSDLMKAAAPARTTVGRLMLYQALPKEARDERLLTDPSFIMDRGTLSDILTEVARKNPKDFGDVADKFKDIGNEFSTGISVGLDDVLSDHRYRDEVFREAAKEERRIRARNIGSRERDEKIVDLYIKAGEKIDKRTKATANAGSNRMYDWIRSGARGSWDQFKQMTVSPVLVADSRGEPVPIPIPKSYSEGLDIGSYFAAAHGARMGTIGKVAGTRAPGAISKQLINTAMNQLVTGEDCGTTKGITLGTENRDVLDRLTARDIRLGKKGGADKGMIPAGTIVTPDVVSRLKNNKISKVEVRSPLKCAHGTGVCSKCYGLNEEGKLSSLGTNLGLLAAQSLGEPATQLAMNCNAAGNLVVVKNDYNTETMTFEEFWDSVPSFVDVADGIETKVPLGVEIWDQTGFVPVLTMQRHKPQSKMVLVRTESGHSLVVEADHPMWARKLVPKCKKVECSHEEPVRFVGHYKDGSKASVRCRECHRPFQLTPEEYEGQQERVVEASGLEGYYVGVSGLLGDGVLVEEPPLPPYLLGIYVSEGNIRRAKNKQHPQPGGKKRQTSPYGLFWKPLGVCITQNEGEIRERILRELEAAGFAYTENSEKGITLHDVKLARELWSKCGTGSHAIRLPREWVSWSPEALKLVLAGILDGDGTSKDGHPQLDTTSWALASQVAEMVRMLGGYACIYDTPWREASLHQGYRVSIKLKHYLPGVKDFKLYDRPLERSSYSKVVSVKEVEYEGWTYDVSTPSRAFSSNGVRNHNSFHTGGVVGAKGTTATGKFRRLEQIFGVPKTLPGAATLSDVEGKVTKIEKDPAAGGWRVRVAGTSTQREHYVPATRKLMVGRGDDVKMGDALSSGPKNPRDMLARTSMNAVQKYLTDEMWDAYEGEGPVRRRNVETFVRAMTNLSTVSDPGDHDTLLRGDKVPTSEVVAFNRGLPPGKRPVQHKPILQGVDMLPIEMQTDWIARLQSRNLKSTVLDAASEGWKSMLHSSHPIPGMAYGKEFGKGTEGAPWLY